MPKVLISDELSPRAVEIFKERGVDVDVKVGLKPDQLRAIVDEYDGLAIRSATKVTAEVLAEQQRIADAFVTLKLIPKPIKVADAAWTAPASPQQAQR